MFRCTDLQASYFTMRGTSEDGRYGTKTYSGGEWKLENDYGMRAADTRHAAGG